MGLSPPWAGVVVSGCCLGRLGFPPIGEGTVKPGHPWAVPSGGAAGTVPLSCCVLFLQAP